MFISMPDDVNNATFIAQRLLEHVGLYEDPANDVRRALVQQAQTTALLALVEEVRALRGELYQLHETLRRASGFAPRRD